jgi:hypothetical protein
MKPDGNIAFKLNWVYGKDGPFTSPCTAAGRAINIGEAYKVWCSQSQNNCYRAYAAGNKAGPVSGSPCYETDAFRNWSFSGGVYHNGPRRGTPIPIRFALPGKVAFFTSRRPDMKEHDRIVLAVFEIAEVEEDDGQVWVSGKRGLRVPTSLLHHAPKFWEFYRQAAAPRWGCGLKKAPRFHVAIPRCFSSSGLPAADSLPISSRTATYRRGRRIP